MAGRSSLQNQKNADRARLGVFHLGLKPGLVPVGHLHKALLLLLAHHLREPDGGAVRQGGSAAPTLRYVAAVHSHATSIIIYTSHWLARSSIKLFWAELSANNAEYL